MSKLLVKDILEKINSNQKIVIRYEFHREVTMDPASKVIPADNLIVCDMQTEINTSMYGIPFYPVEEEILNREVRYLFPMRGDLYLYLETEVPKK